MAIAVVAHTAKAAASPAVTSAIDTTGATLLVVASTSFNTTGALTDSKNNTWTQLTIRTNGVLSCKGWYCANPIVGSGHTFTLTLATDIPSIEVIAFSGAKTSSPLDQQTGATGSGNTGQGGSLTPSANNCVMISMRASTFANPAPTIDLSYTITDSNPAGTPTGAHCGAIAYLIQTTAAAKNPTWTGGGAGEGWAIINAVFLPASTGNVTAVAATATAAFVAPTVGGKANVNAVVATASAAMRAPAVKAAGTFSAVKGTASAAMVPPTIHAGGIFAAVKATATALMVPPAVATFANVNAVRATAAAAMVPPTIQAAGNFVAVAASATAGMGSPTITAGVVLTAVKATASAAMGTPAIKGAGNFQASAMTATAAMRAPVAGITHRPSPFRHDPASGDPSPFRPTSTAGSPGSFRPNPGSDDPGVFRPN